MKYNVAVLGASSSKERYSYKAVRALGEAGYNVFPVNPSEQEVNGHTCYPNLGSIGQPLDTITVYLSEKNSTPLIEEILAVAPRRIILNPGAENEDLKKRCKATHIIVQEACTLVLISTGQF